MKLLHLHIAIALAALLAGVSSCNRMTRLVGTVGSKTNKEQADSALHAAYKYRDYEGMMQMADSFETSGALTDVEANYWRGYACSKMRQLRRAELYWKEAVSGDIRQSDNVRYYLKSANRLSNMLLLKGDYEGSLKVAMPAMEQMAGLGGDTIGDFANLLTSIASCQLKMGLTAEASENYRRANRNYQNIVRQHPADGHFKSAAVCIITTTTTYLNEKLFDEAYEWTRQFADLLEQYEQLAGYDSVFLDKERTRLLFYRATALQGMERTAEAAKIYGEALQTQYARTGDGQIEATEYLMAAGRWSEAARNYRLLDKQMALYNMDLSMDNLQQYLIPKFRANTRAGLRDSAVSVAVQITDALDKAIDDQKKNDAAELATIYDTQQKEAQIAQQKAEMSNQRLVGTAIALILVVTFFIIYTLNKRKAQLHLAAAHEKLEDAHARLKTAYDQLETTTKAKERIESELRIASDIQQSMLPSVFPNQQGLDLYGSMTPAKEVGGDLYDYLLTDTDHLYFCLGDVSGKSVPAALFMAQAIRMFRALAKQGLMPADIATRLNDELTIGNENGMFVTMFIGLVDLQTGHLDYCNAGHNPPVVGHHFLEMESNAPIGLWEGLQFVGEALPNVKDTLIFVYSDGLNEAENRQLEQFGEERLLNLLNSRPFDSARQVIDTFNAAVEAHRDGADRNDDLTMLCLMVR